MALARTRLADIAQIGTTAAAVLTNASGAKTYVRGVTLYNDNGSAETVKLYNVPDSSGSVGTAAAGNKFLEYNLATKETFLIGFDYPIVLKDANDTIQASTTTASKVTIMLHGDTE